MGERKQDLLAAPTSERRREPRFKGCHSALLTTPNAPPIEAWVLDVSSNGARLRVPNAVRIGVAVRVDAKELLLFGTITHCEETDGAFSVGIALSRALEVLADMERLNESLFVEPEPPESGAAP
jgi:hypothetical protein